MESGLDIGRFYSSYLGNNKCPTIIKQIQEINFPNLSTITLSLNNIVTI